MSVRLQIVGGKPVGERAQRAYDEVERGAFRTQPRQQRLKQNLVAALVVGGLAAVLVAYALGPLRAETVEVKYRGPIELDSFDCTGELDSSLVKRVCYNAEHEYMLIRLKGTWYHYCEIDAATVHALLNAPSLGRFYNQSVKDSGTGGLFSCRDKQVPQF